MSDNLKLRLCLQASQVDFTESISALIDLIEAKVLVALLQQPVSCNGRNGTYLSTYACNPRRRRSRRRRRVVRRKIRSSSMAIMSSGSNTASLVTYFCRVAPCSLLPTVLFSGKSDGTGRNTRRPLYRKHAATPRKMCCRDRNFGGKHDVRGREEISSRERAEKAKKRWETVRIKDKHLWRFK